MIIIVGAGIAGISASYHLGLKGKDSIIFEKDETWGGLSGNFEKDGFLFDKAVHLSFTENEYVKSLFAESTDLFRYEPEPTNYYNGVWLKHPAQNNIFPLEVEEKIRIISDFIRREQKKKIPNYETWLRCQYGNYFSENFPMRYCKKYWTCEAKELSTTWIKKRMYTPKIEEVLLGAMTDDTPLTYYAKEMRYPKKGGYKQFFSLMAKKCDFRYNKKINLIDSENKIIFFTDGTSESKLPRLLSVLYGHPLP
jgi:protoporphyrinogen oxidase